MANIISVLESHGIKLSKKERNWIGDNLKKRNLHIDRNKPLFIKLEDINPQYHTIIQDAKQRSIHKFNSQHYAIIVANSGIIQLFNPI